MIRVATPSVTRDPLEPEAEAFAAGDPHAMGALFERYRDRLVNVAMRHFRTHRPHLQPVQRFEAEDIVQECYLSVWARRNRQSHYSGSSPVYIWLRSCLRCTLFSRHAHDTRLARRGNKTVRSLEVDKADFNYEPIGGPDPVTVACRREEYSRFAQAVETLPAHHRTIVLAHFHGDSFRDIGNSLGVSRQAVFRQYQRGMDGVAWSLGLGMRGGAA